MISFQIQDVKDFMNQLLLKTAFAPILVVEGSVTTYNTFHIDGHLQADYYSSQEQEALNLSERRYSRWKDLRPFCLELIKGKRTPLGFRFTFQLSSENTQKLLTQTESPFSLKDVSGLILNIRYDSAGLFCTTAISWNLFTLDKSLEHSWDQMVQKFLLKQEIAFTLP